MEIISGTTDFYLNKETAVAIGKFDGVHIGHRRLLEEILMMKKNSGSEACVFTFDPAPTTFFGQGDGKELTTSEEKRLLLERMGVDVLIEFPLTQKTAAISPEAFVSEILSNQMNAVFIAAGKDVSFGSKGAGDETLLQEMGAEYGFSVKTIEKVRFQGREVSSSYIRSLVEQGRMEAAKTLLGMPYMIAGTVQHGKRVGRTIGFPTANLLPEANKLLPPKGVYFSEVRCRGQAYRAITNIGCKPTVTDEQIVGAESYLYDFEGDLYGEQIEVLLKSFHRPEQRFDSLEALQQQLEKDIAAGDGKGRKR